MLDFEKLTYFGMHNHTDGSNGRIIDSIIKTQQLVDNGQAIGLAGVSITDHECLSSLIEGMDINNKLNKEGSDFKIGLGNEIYLVNSMEEVRDNYQGGGVTKFPHFVLVAKNEIGFEALRVLSTEAWKESYNTGIMKRVPTTKENFAKVLMNPKYKGSVIGSTACFTEGHDVKTKDGLKPIEQFLGGEIVWTNQGWQKVNYPTSRQYEGDIYTITSQGGTLPVSCTSSHKFLSINKEEEKDYVKYGYNKELLEGKYGLNTLKSQQWKKGVTNSPIQWKEANKLNIGDLLLTPIDMSSSDLEVLDMSHIPNKFPRKKLDFKSNDLSTYKFKVDRDFLRMIGIYMAEGHMSKLENGYSVSWTLHEDTKDIQHFLSNYLCNFGLNAIISQKGESKGIELTVNSKHFRMIMEEIVSKQTSHTKTTPSFILKLPVDKQMHYLKGLFEGDGYYRKDYKTNGVISHREVVYASCSKQLAIDTVEILNRMSINCSLNLRKEYTGKDGTTHKDAYYVRIGGKVADIVNEFVWEDKEMKSLIYSDLLSKDFLVEHEGVFYMRHKITHISKIHCCTQVYCLNVDKAHNFTIEGVLAHNCLGGEIPLEYRKYMNGDSSAMDRIDKFVRACQTVLGENNFYLEIQPGNTEEQIQYNQFILMYGKTKGVKVIFTTDSHYLKKEDANLHSAFLNSKDAEREVASFYSSTYMMSTKEVWEYFEDYVKEEEFIEMCNNSMDIYNSIEVYNTSRDTLVPQIPIPPFSQDNRLFIEGKEYEYINKMINSEHLIDRYLISNLHQGMIKYNQEYSKEELERINIEIEQIWEISEKLHSRLSSYYLLTKDIVDIAWTVSLVGVGRGSSCGFYICYLLGITQLNPMKHEDLKYWRHLEKSKYSLPDIDIDFESDKKPKIIELIKDKYGHDRVLNIVTFKTLTSKASINTVGKGLGYTNDEISAISGTIPFERGKNWSLSDCVYGNEEKNRKPVPHFKTVMEKYPNLVEYAMLLEGLRTNISVHASGLYVMDEDYRKTNSLMITPGGESVTAWNMEQSDSQGALKVDILLIDALSKIRSCMDLLLEEGKIEWKGTLRDTYEFYIHPDKLVMEGEEVFKPIYNGVVTNVFQFETPLGQQVLRKVAPHTLYELCNANSLMRLSTKETEQPLKRYIRYKGNINEWYSDMKKWGLSKEEINIMKEHLLPRYGMAEVQESVMTLSMDSRISNFTLTESDKLRKGLAKGKPKLVQECRELFYKKGKEAGTSLALLDYVWDKQISMSLGYAFNSAHVLPYSTIALQEGNLVLNYGSIFWQCACLIVNSFTHTDDKGVNYGKLAKALTSIKSKHPSINNSKRGFSVNGEDIIYGLKPLIGVGEALTDEIISKRPFVSFEDFMDRVENKTNASVLSLIKSGAFDEFGVSREVLMGEYIKSITKIKSKLTLSNVSELFELGVLDKNEFEKPLLFISVYKFVCSKSNLIHNEELKGQWFKVIKEIEVDFLNLYNNLKDNEFIYNCDGLIVKKSAIEREMKKNSLEIMELLKSTEVLNNLNSKLIDLSTEQYAKGSIRRWEFDSMNSYEFGTHELDNVTLGKYNVVGFESISSEPIISDSGVSAKTGTVWKKFETQLIAGTVVDKDKNNSYISLLTKDGLIGVRFNKGQFNHYDSSIAYVQDNGKKKVVDKSWFSKGTLLIIQGYRSEDEFRAKKYSDSILQHTCIKIVEIKDNDIKVQLERACVEV